MGGAGARPYSEAFAQLVDTEVQRILSENYAAAVKLLKRALSPQGFNIGANLGKVAGAGIVEHLHLHVVPRWNGDTNFMPVIGDTTVLPEALKDVAQKLRAALSR